MFRFPGFNPYGARPGLSGQFGGMWHPQSAMHPQGMIHGNSPVAAQAQSYGQGMTGNSAPMQGQASQYGAMGGSYSGTSAPMNAQSMISGNGPVNAQASMMASQAPQNGQAMQAAQGQSYGAAPSTSPGSPAQGGAWHPGVPLPQQGMIQGNGPVNTNAGSYGGGLAAQIGARR